MRRSTLALVGLLVLAAPALGDDVTKKHRVDARISSLQGRLAEHRRQEAALRNEVADYTSRILTLEAKVGGTTRCTLTADGLDGTYGVTVKVTKVECDQASFDVDFLKSIWVAAIPGFIVAAAATYFASVQWAQRMWIGWLFLMPIGGLVVLGYSLKTYFVR